MEYRYSVEVAWKVGVVQAYMHGNDIGWNERSLDRMSK